MKRKLNFNCLLSSTKQDKLEHNSKFIIQCNPLRFIHPATATWGSKQAYNKGGRIFYIVGTFLVNSLILIVFLKLINTEIKKYLQVHQHSRSPGSATRLTERVLHPSLFLEPGLHLDWPKGSYSLPRPTSGCPFSRKTKWHYGYRLCDDVRPKKIYNSTKFNATHLRNSISPFYFVEEYCTKKSRSTNERYLNAFPLGSYCIYKAGANCPQGFQSGSLRFYENRTRINKTWSHVYGNAPQCK